MQRNFNLPGRSPVHACECVVATSHPLASTTAINILKEGGNAVDAALAASATLCVVEPHMTGVGGDCFAMIAEPDGKLHGLNGSGRSAANAALDWYLENGFEKIPVTSAHAVTAPGAVMAWQTMHQKFGAMDFTRLFADAIRYAEDGFPVAPRVASDWQKLVGKLNGNKAAATSLLINGKPPETGQVMRLPLLAKTLRRIAVEGAPVIYEREIAAEIAKTVQDAGGFLTEEDLANVAAEWVDPISTEYNGFLLHELPPNAQGLAALVIATLLRKTGPAKEANSVERAHMEIECGRIGYEFRDRYVSDIDHMRYSVEELLSETHIGKMAKLFNPAKRNPDIQLPDPAGSDTIYLSVVDRDGMAVSFINSVFSGFGTGIMTPQSGIILQNRGSGFCLEAGHGNAIGPSRLPLHTIIPAMLTKAGKVTHSFGVMGGPYQAMGHAHVVSNMLDYGMDPQQALDDPRIFWNDKGVLELETGVSQKTEKGLQALGHKCVRGAVHGGGQIIQISHEQGILIAGSDSRKDGHAAGY